MNADKDMLLTEEPTVASVCLLSAVKQPGEATEHKPNVILCMADDLGWGDTAYNGNRVAITPNLDLMAEEGIRFDRFYSAAPVCSPTRASCLTGRNPYRTGVFFANEGILRPEEFSMMDYLKGKGYQTGHFGKWHLGTLTHTETDANRGRPGNDAEFNPPWLHGFDTCFSTESKVPTWDPMKKPHQADQQGWQALENDQPYMPYGTHYWNQDGEKVTDNLEGDDSRVIMDRAISFIGQAAEADDPFLAVIWFHAPHLPCVASPTWFSTYKRKGLNDQAASYYGCISALDQEMGRLRDELHRLGIADNTMLWFCSDNGPEGKSESGSGSAGPFRGRKRDLYEGGVRVPGLLVWPAVIREGMVSDVPCVTSDFLPTVMDVFGERHADRKFDGESILSLIVGEPFKRQHSIGFKSQHRCAWSQGRYKLYTDQWGQHVGLYDLIEDPGEAFNLVEKKPELVESLVAEYGLWEKDVKASFEGVEYGRESYDRLGQQWPGNGMKQ